MKCVLFLLNTRGYGYEYGCECGGCGSCTACCEGSYNSGMPWANNSGLFNSCAFVVDMLNASGVPARLIQINGGAEIEQHIKACNPTEVVIEALFVPPVELGKLINKYPNIHWFIRLHSEIPFLVQEGRALQWIHDYLTFTNVSMSANTLRARNDLHVIVKSYFPWWDQETLNHRVMFLPNYYPTPAPLGRIPSPFGTLNLGCLGAIRTLKNQALQAVAAIALGASLGKRVRFHVNATRIEGQSGSILSNLRALFRGAVNAELVEHGWVTRTEFLDLCRRMDLGMQVSFSETFNIVSADFATNNIPLLVSPEVTWTDRRIQADSTSTGDMVKKGLIALRASSIVEANRKGLLQYNNRSRATWLQVFGEKSPVWTPEPKAYKARPAITSLQTHM